MEDNQEVKYNDIPVKYCNRCLSLAIVGLEDDMEYCDKCGGIIIDEAHISEWEKKYQEKYGIKLLNE